MKALTLTQPWATAIVEGRKVVETRSWSASYRGTILIHAAKGWRRDDMRYAVELHRRGVLATPARDLPRGAIVARARLVAIYRVEDIAAIDLLERELGDYSPGRFAWQLEDVEPIAPIPWRGALGLWEGPDLA